MMKLLLLLAFAGVAAATGAATSKGLRNGALVATGGGGSHFCCHCGIDQSAIPVSDLPSFDADYDPRLFGNYGLRCLARIHVTKTQRFIGSAGSECDLACQAVTKSKVRAFSARAW